MSYLWPIITGYTFIDVWTLPHLGFWIFIGSTLWALHCDIWRSFAICFTISLAWEVFEIAAFQIWPQHWKDPESLINSWISDPLTCVIGVLGIWYLLEHRRTRSQ